MIRPYEPADCEQVLEVWARASALAHPFLSEAFFEQERHDIRHLYLPSTETETWVWEAGGRVAGFVSLLGSEVGALFVDPELHRSGIGRALVEWARELRGELEVEVFERNQLGRTVYAALGFEQVARKVHEPTGFELLRLRLAPELPGRPSAG